MDKVCYWDEVEGCQKERDCTPEEQAEIDARRAAGPSPDEVNAPILASLEEIDRKSIRALREGNSVRIAELESQATELRLQLKK